MRISTRIAVFVVVVILAASLVMGCAAPAPAPKTPSPTPAPTPAPAPTVIKWKGQYSYPTTTPYGPFQDKRTAGLNALPTQWFEWVTKATNGRLQVEWAEPGAIFPVADTDKAVAEGTVQVSLSSGLYYRGRFPEGDIEGGGVMFWASDQDAYDCFYNWGLFDAMQKVYRDKLKLVYFPVWASSRTSIGTTFDAPGIDSIKGKKIRAVGVQADYIAGLGGSPTMVALGELYQALKLGTVDGWVAGSALLEVNKLKEVTKGWVNNPVISWTPSNVIINMKAWDALPDDIKKILQEQHQYASFVTSQAWGNQNQYGLEQAQKGGTKIWQWSQADEDQAVQIARTKVWGKMYAASPESKMLMDIIMKQRAAWGRPTM